MSGGDIMKGKHALFHIGIPKSGTTSVQSTLSNDERLLVTRSRYFTSKDWWTEPYPDYPLDKIVIESNETLVSGGFQKVKFIEVVKRMYQVNPEAKILLTIRNQESALRSMYKYHIKFGHKGVKSIGHWALKTELGIDYVSICMFDSMIACLLAYFPKSQVFVLPFEWLVANPKEFYTQLYSIIGIPLQENVIQHQALNVMRFDDKELYTMVRLNTIPFRKDSMLHKLDLKIRRRLGALLKLQPPDGFFSIAGIDGYYELLNEFAAGNRYIVENGFVSKEMMTKFGYKLN